VVVVAGHDNQYTESDERVERARFMTNSTESGVSSSNVMASSIGITNLSHSMLRENKENSIESLCGFGYLLIHKSLFVYVYT